MAQPGRGHKEREHSTIVQGTHGATGADLGGLQQPVLVSDRLAAGPIAGVRAACHGRRHHGGTQRARRAQPLGEPGP